MASHGPDERCAECSGPLETITVWRTEDAFRVSAWTELCCVDRTCPAYDVAVATGPVPGPEGDSEGGSETPGGPGVS